jgi:hypothetical protein
MVMMLVQGGLAASTAAQHSTHNPTQLREVTRHGSGTIRGNTGRPFQRKKGLLGVNFRRAQPSVVLPPNGTGSGKCLTTHYIIKLRDDEDKAFGGKMLTSPEVTGLPRKGYPAIRHGKIHPTPDARGNRHKVARPHRRRIKTGLLFCPARSPEADTLPQTHYVPRPVILLKTANPNRPLNHLLGDGTLLKFYGKLSTLSASSGDR